MQPTYGSHLGIPGIPSEPGLTNSTLQSMFGRQHSASSRSNASRSPSDTGLPPVFSSDRRSLHESRSENDLNERSGAEQTIDMRKSFSHSDARRTTLGDSALSGPSTPLAGSGFRAPSGTAAILSSSLSEKAPQSQSSWFSEKHIESLKLPVNVTHVSEDPALTTSISEKRRERSLSGSFSKVLLNANTAGATNGHSGAVSPQSGPTTPPAPSDLTPIATHLALSGATLANSFSVGTPRGNTSSSAKPALRSPRSTDFTIMRAQHLGTGSFGTVYKAFDNVHGRQAAVKECPFDKNTKKKVDREFAILKGLSHPNIVCVYDFSVVDNTSQIFMEWMPGGSVRTTMKQTGFRLHENVIRRFTHDALLGLAYLHGASILHRDIKPANMLLDNNGIVKLSDFGTSHMASANGTHSTRGVVGTAAYMAPEVIAKGKHSFKSDIWALACSVIEMATGHLPWSRELDRERFRNPVSLMFFIGTLEPPKHHPEIPEHLSPELQQALRWCFSFEPDERPTADQLLGHSYFHNIDEPPAGAENMASFTSLLCNRRPSLDSEDSSGQLLRTTETTEDPASQ